jgi:hypothetical protein
MPDQKPIKVKTRKTATRVRVKPCAQLPTEVVQDQEPEYTDEQFYADLRKAKKQLDAMEKQALKEYREGKTRKFPV